MSHNIEVIDPQKELKTIHPVYCYVPTKKLQQFVRALLSEECMGNKFKAEKLSGVSKGQFYHKIKDPAFREWFSRQCDEALQAYEGAAASALIRRVKKGETAAIKLFYELIGKIKGAVGVGVAIQNTIIQEYDRFNDGMIDDERLMLIASMKMSIKLADDRVKDEDISKDEIGLLFDIVDVRPDLIRKILDGIIKPPVRVSDMNPGHPALTKEPFWKRNGGTKSRCLTEEEKQNLPRTYQPRMSNDC